MWEQKEGKDSFRVYLSVWVDDCAFRGVRRLREEEFGRRNPDSCFGHVLATPEFMMRVGHAGGDVKEMLGNVHLRLQGEARLRIPIFRFGSHRDDLQPHGAG